VKSRHGENVLMHDLRRAQSVSSPDFNERWLTEPGVLPAEIMSHFRRR
jgi:hypothetical protein